MSVAYAEQSITKHPARTSLICSAKSPQNFPLLCCQAAMGLVATTYGVPLPALRSMSRGKANVAFARQVAMYLHHVVCHLTLTEIAVAFNRDRTTVAHGCRTVEDRRDDPLVDAVISILEWSMKDWQHPNTPDYSSAK